MSETVVDGDERTVWRILGEPRRHHVVRHLNETNDVTTTADISRVIAEDCEVEYERIQSALRHVDVPKLADAGVVEYDAERDRIESTARVRRLCAILEAVEERLE
ncbi:DUF7344 domain-containing protein [Halovivax cerinus]|uniref:DUF7344 domain-containing protein n=1 Tax=Halovivax cerinus TaxID=1487865 RepID=A0ABD5NKU8_9EURY|nr:hypothetical protein [Halovivax cerinus]